MLGRLYREGVVSEGLDPHLFEGVEVHTGRVAEGAIDGHGIGCPDEVGERHLTEGLLIELDEGGTAFLVQFVFRREIRSLQGALFFDSLDEFRRERRQSFAIEREMDGYTLHEP